LNECFGCATAQVGFSKEGAWKRDKNDAQVLEFASGQLQ
jgi:hypothetical protein